MDRVFMFLLALLIPLTAIVGGLMFAGLSMYRRTRLKELAYRERLALIEKGLMPSPETDPARFAQLMRDVPEPGTGRRGGGGRQRSLGVMLIGLGCGLATVIAFAGDDPEAALGVGGLIFFIGLAMVVNGFLSSRDEPMSAAPPALVAPPKPPNPPDPSVGL